MAKEYEQKFQWIEEAEEYAREVFKNIGAGHGYYGRIIIKNTALGYDKDNNVVRQYTNKFGTLYAVINYKITVTSTQPAMNVIF